jgi:hypothetical protein
MKELLSLHQTGSIDDYIELFERLKSKLLLENRLFSETDFLDAFVRGLKLEIKSFVKVFKPQGLDDAYEHALHLEGAIEYQYKRLKSTSKPFTLPPPSKPVVPATVPRNTHIEQRRALGLCFKCGEKYPDHHCKVKVQMLLGQSEDLIEAVEPESDSGGTICASMLKKEWCQCMLLTLILLCNPCALKDNWVPISFLPFWIVGVPTALWTHLFSRVNRFQLSSLNLL